MIPNSTGTDEFEDGLEFMNRCDIAEFGKADTSREDMEQFWSEIDPARDAWITRDAQRRVIGFADVEDASEGFQMDIYIHPVETPAGVEEELMALCLARAAERLAGAPAGTAPFLTGYATSQNRRLQRVYETSGFKERTRHYNMRVDLDIPLEAPEWPADFHLADYQPEDEQELYHFIQRAFDWEGHTNTPIELWRNHLFRGGRYDPALFVLVRDAKRLVGAALAYDEENSGWIRQLAFDRAYRGRGMGSLLLRHMFSLFQRRGVGRAGGGGGE